MVCLALRAPGDSVRPRRSSGVVVRPLNFTVRQHASVTSAFDVSGLGVGPEVEEKLRCGTPC